MKKTPTPAKLMLKLETVKTLRTLKVMDLAHVVGGATNPCTHPTTTVLTLGGC